MARASATSRGSTVKSLRNTGSATAARARASWPAIRDWPELDDGYAVHAPVDSFRPNPLGLHNVLGNVWEWCLDGYDGRFYVKSPLLDPLCDPDQSDYRTLRGGSFANAAKSARSAVRRSYTPDSRYSIVGLRPARSIDQVEIPRS